MLILLKISIFLNKLVQSRLRRFTQNDIRNKNTSTIDPLKMKRTEEYWKQK